MKKKQIINFCLQKKISEDEENEKRKKNIESPIVFNSCANSIHLAYNKHTHTHNHTHTYTFRINVFGSIYTHFIFFLSSKLIHKEQLNKTCYNVIPNENTNNDDERKERKKTILQINIHINNSYMYIPHRTESQWARRQQLTRNKSPQYYTQCNVRNHNNVWWVNDVYFRVLDNLYTHGRNEKIKNTKIERNKKYTTLENIYTRLCEFRVRMCDKIFAHIYMRIFVPTVLCIFIIHNFSFNPFSFIEGFDSESNICSLFMTIQCNIQQNTHEFIWSK